jgi:hypothetical protein
MTKKPLLCRLGIHKWQTRHNDEDETYLLCRRCGTEHYVMPVDVTPM